MTSKETLNNIRKYNQALKEQYNINEYGVGSLHLDNTFMETLEQAQKDVELLDLFKKYFAGVSQEKESGRWFIDMSELEGADLAVFLKLCEE